MAYGNNPWDNSAIILNDRRGENMAQGLSSLGQSGAQAIHSYQQNKMMVADATARFESALQANPELQQVLASEKAPAEALKAYEKLQKDGAIDVRSAAYLAQFVDSYGQRKQQVMQQKLQQTQLENEQQVMAARAQQLAQQNKNAQALQAMFGGQPTADDAMKYLRRTPLPASSGQPMAQDAQSMLQRYTQAGGTLNNDVVDLATRLEASRVKGTGGPMSFGSVGQLLDQYPSDKFDYTFVTDPQTGRVSVKGVSPRAPVNTMPPGYQADPTTPGAVRPIPGSKDAMDRQEAAVAKQNAVKNEVARADVVLNAITNVLPRVDALTTSFSGTVLNKIPGTDAADVAALIDTIKGNIGVEQLMQMRAASRNGASGFGQLSEKELDVLQSTLGNLSTRQSPAQLRKTLGDVKTHFERWKMAVNGVDPDGASAPLQIKSVKLLK